MKKLAHVIETFGWAIFGIGILVGLGFVATLKQADLFNIIIWLGVGILPGTLLLLICLAHKHYLLVAEKLDNYLNDQMSRPTSWQVQPPTFANMPSASPPASRQKPQQPGEPAKE